MPTYYTYKDQVSLLPGQTLGFTSGKGYYAAGAPTSPSSATQPSNTLGGVSPTQAAQIAANAGVNTGRASVQPAAAAAGAGGNPIGGVSPAQAAQIAASAGVNAGETGFSPSRPQPRALARTRSAGYHRAKPHRSRRAQESVPAEASRNLQYHRAPRPTRSAAYRPPEPPRSPTAMDSHHELHHSSQSPGPPCRPPRKTQSAGCLRARRFRSALATDLPPAALPRSRFPPQRPPEGRRTRSAASPHPKRPKSGLITDSGPSLRARTVQALVHRGRRRHRSRSRSQLSGPTEHQLSREGGGSRHRLWFRKSRSSTRLRTM